MKITKSSLSLSSNSMWSIVGSALIFSLSNCSDSALHSPLYEPYPDDEVIIIPQTLEKQIQDDAPTTTSSRTNSNRSNTNTNLNNDTNTTKIAKSSQADDAFRRVRPLPEKSWKIFIENESAFAEALSHIPASSDATKISISKMVLSIRLKTTRLLPDSGERHLDGDLILEQGDDQNKDLVSISLKNLGPVVYTATKTNDLMQAKFKINYKQYLKLELSRRPTVLVEDIENNPWAGTIYLVEKNAEETKLGKISGYVLPSR